ncbi:hemocyanin-like [Neodiprion fabricii]|uniref:hemocyanin-like n=1 Tax=Neodiprion fabricii TaxID=2872261 RepID=UPI001ED922FC|nr:hemocyanin-like [Neodiprion fabricii]
MSLLKKSHGFIMKLAIVFLAIFAAGVSASLKKADTTFLGRQLRVLYLLKNLSEPLQDEDLLALRASFNPETCKDYFNNPETLELFMHEMKRGSLLGREEIFSLFDAKHRYQVKLLFNALMSAKDWSHFMGLSTYIRDKMNHRQFLYAFSTALLHREDCRGIKLPPAYEIIPQMFLTTDVVRRAYQAQMQGKPTLIPMSFTGSVLNPEQRVAYFGEDVGLNAHHAHWHMDFPFWADERKDRAGELFFYMHHQLLARFDAERLSNHLPPVEPLQWEKPIVEGFAPGAVYPGGQEFPVRPDNMFFQNLPERTVADMIEFENRIRDGIDAGMIRDKNGVVVFLNNTEGIDVLGSLIESSTSSLDPRYFGSLHTDAHLLLSRVTDPKGKYGMTPGVMEHFETATRDPAFFRLHKHIDNLFKEHKDRLPPYTYDDLAFPGVRITALKVVGESKASDPNVLVTYFDESYIDLGNAVQGKPVSIRAVVSRLNHEPFKLVATVYSNKNTYAIARVFLAPSKSWFDEDIQLDEARWSMIELDRFPVELRIGSNLITRRSIETSVTASEPLSYPELMKKAKSAFQGESVFEVDTLHRHCGFPHRLLLPQGRHQGMDFKLYVILTDLKTDLHSTFEHPYVMNEIPALSYCGVLDGVFPDIRPMGFPFDRRIIHSNNFQQANTKVIDVTIKNVKYQ